MTAFLVDTNVISELRKGSKTDPGVQQWFTVTESDDLYLSVLVIGELRRGIELIRRRDPISAQHLEAWLRRILKDYVDHILPVTQEIAELRGGLSLDKPLPPIDGMLAATAMYHDMVLVTRNVQGRGARFGAGGESFHVGLIGRLSGRGGLRKKGRKPEKDRAVLVKENMQHTQSSKKQAPPRAARVARKQSDGKRKHSRRVSMRQKASSATQGRLGCKRRDTRAASHMSLLSSNP